MKPILLILFLVYGLTVFSQNNRGLQYVESSAGLNYPTWESGMTELEFADIDRDGYIDILSIGDHGSPYIGTTEYGIMVWFGNETGTWSVQMNGNFGYGGTAIGDVNNDGHWDVGYGMHHNYSSTDFGDQLIEVALGDGSGTNWTPWDNGLATNGESWGMFGTDFADVDNDGDLDLGSNSFGSGSGLHVYINQGDGSWIQSYGILPGNSNMRFVFGDFNNDGNADFVVTHDAGIVFFGDGNGNFTNADHNLPNYSFPMSGPDIGDVNNDGAQELAYVNPNGGVMVWTFNSGTSQWVNISGTLPVSGNYQEAQLCDFNSDGVADLAAFGNAHLTVWTAELAKDRSVIWTQEFTTTTSNNGDCNAFRAGGDVDRNGFPDMTLVEKVGSWPNDVNHLKCFKETTPYSEANILAVSPKGKEVFRQGSVQFIDWISAVPSASESTVKIDYSLQGSNGPWILVTSGTENSGRYQWILPLTISTNNCFIRYTLVEGTDTLIALTPTAFTILGSNGLVADFIADSTMVNINSPVHFTDLSMGLITSWQWDFDNNGIIDATERNPTYSYDQSGLYTVKLTISDGTGSQTEIKDNYINVLTPVGIKLNEETDEAFMIYPNPFSGFLILQYAGIETQDLTFDLFTISGKKVFQIIPDDKSIGKSSIQIRTNDLPPGIYFYRFQSWHRAISGKLVKLND